MGGEEKPKIQNTKKIIFAAKTKLELEIKRKSVDLAEYQKAQGKRQFNCVVILCCFAMIKKTMKDGACYHTIFSINIYFSDWY